MPYRIIINPDKEKADTIRLSVANNGGFCPCRLIKTKDTKCMCKEFRERDSAGQCHCGLYLKVEDTPSVEGK